MDLPVSYIWYINRDLNGAEGDQIAGYPEETEEREPLMPGGEAPRYPDWVYEHVVIPRLLWEERQEHGRVEEPARALTPTDRRRVSTPCDVTHTSDYAWWLDSDSTSSTCSSPPVVSTSPSPRTYHVTRHSWAERWRQVRERRQKIEDEKLSRIRNKIEEKNKRLAKFKKSKLNNFSQLVQI